MKSCFFTISVRSWAVSILILVLMLNTGCSIKAPLTSKVFKIKSFEEIMDEKYKNLKSFRELRLGAEISSQVNISHGNPYYSVKYLKANLKILPMIDNRQKILSFEMKPPGKVVDGSLKFTLDDPSPGFYRFNLKAEIVCRYEDIKVTDKIPFPFQATTAEQIKYTKPSSLIDSDNEHVKKLASSIAKGEDDLYRVVFKASKWVMENVTAEFDNSTVYASQKASWVLENREGVCDEKTNLLIGLLRSLGIPVKFITGFVGIYYNHEITFKSHSWAEVYFPSAGWIPFDVAYNQLGFIDATHIKLSESVDISDPLTSYEWKFVDISDHHSADDINLGDDLVSIKSLRIRASVKQETGIVAPILEVKPKVWHGNIDIESYNVIEATVLNPNKFYVITDISLQIPPELKIMGRNKKELLLEPNTRLTVYWIVKPTYSVVQNMITVFPVNIVASKSAPAGVEFHVATGQGYPKYSLESLKYQVGKRQEQIK